MKTDYPVIPNELIKARFEDLVRPEDCQFTPEETERFKKLSQSVLAAFRQELKEKLNYAVQNSSEHQFVHH